MAVRVLDPRLEAEGGALQLAPALQSLQGAVVGMIDNTKIGTTRLFDHIEEILKGHGVREFIRLRKTDHTKAASREELATLRGADAILSATGD